MVLLIGFARLAGLVLLAGLILAVGALLPLVRLTLVWLLLA